MGEYDARENEGYARADLNVDSGKNKFEK